MGFFTDFQDNAYPVAPFAGFPGGPAFSPANAGALAWAAQLAYEVQNAGKLTAIAGRWGWQISKTFNKPLAGPWRAATAKGYVATTTKATTIIAFAGTEPEKIGDWIEDLSILRDGHGVHEGFKAGVTAAWPEVAGSIPPDGPIYLAGHSLGAAIAAAMAQELADTATVSADRIHGVYTIGMPRLGDGKYAGAYNGVLGDRTFRLIHGDDIVTRVPPMSAFDFHHVGRPLAASRGGRFGDHPAPLAEETGNAAEVVELAEAVFQVLIPRNSQPPYPGANALARDVVERLGEPGRDHLADGYLRALDVLRWPSR